MRPTFRTLFAVFCYGWLLSATAGTPDGDPVRGEQLYQRCQACHALNYNRTGPLHCDLLGRKAASVPDFHYSAAMRGSGIVWTPETLDAFLSAPTRYVEGTSMGYAGIDDPRERSDLIAYLARASKDTTLCHTTTKGVQP